MAPTRSCPIAVVYLVLAAVGYLLPDVPMVIESVRTGNILCWTDPARTTAELLANRTSTAFALDLFAVVVVACIWMTDEARRAGVRRVRPFWLLTFVFRLGGTLPLFLWVGERRLTGDGAGVDRTRAMTPGETRA